MKLNELEFLENLLEIHQECKRDYPHCVEEEIKQRIEELKKEQEDASKCEVEE